MFENNFSECVFAGGCGRTSCVDGCEHYYPVVGEEDDLYLERLLQEQYLQFQRDYDTYLREFYN